MNDKIYTKETFAKIKKQIKILEAIPSRSNMENWLLDHYKLLLSTKKIGDSLNETNKTKLRNRLLPRKHPII